MNKSLRRNRGFAGEALPMNVVVAGNRSSKANANKISDMPESQASVMLNTSANPVVI